MRCVLHGINLLDNFALILYLQSYARIPNRPKRSDYRRANGDT
jgi:hypothetical protein